MPSQQSRNWVFTWNNPGFADDSDLETERRALEYFNSMYEQGDFVFCAWQLERGASGTLHVQGYVQFSGNKRLRSLRRLFPGCHAEVRRGTHEEALDYVSKDDTRVEGLTIWQFGTPVIAHIDFIDLTGTSPQSLGNPRNRPGRRRDLEEVVPCRLDFDFPPEYPFSD